MENDGQAPLPQGQQGVQQPIGTTVMNTEVLKEPRGFMRCLECFFAMVAFATCANYGSYTEYRVECTNSSLSQNVRHDFSYPFRLDHSTPVNITCGGDKSFAMYPPGDFKSDAEFFVFTGVVAFLGSILSLVVYVFFSGLYTDDQKKSPFYDFCFTVVIAVFWLSASAAWANGVITMKIVADPSNWLYTTQRSICQKNSNQRFVSSKVADCLVVYTGKFGGANGSVILGFLNFFLWASNLWFVYKETSWFANRSQPGGQPQPLSA